MQPHPTNERPSIAARAKRTDLFDAYEMRALTEAARQGTAGGATPTPSGAVPAATRATASGKRQAAIEDGTLIVDLDGRVLLQDDGAQRMFGITDEANGQTWFSHPFGAQRQYELDVADPDGAIHRVDVRCSDIEWLGTSAVLVSIRPVQDSAAPEPARSVAVDSLTGLLTREAFLNEVYDALRRARHESTRATGAPLAIIRIDIDRFESVNERWGRAVGDRVLCAVAAGIKATVRQGDMVGHLGSDDFVVLVHSQDPDGPARLCNRILERASRPVDVDGQMVEVRAVAGIAWHRTGQDEYQVLDEAEFAVLENRGRFPTDTDGTTQPIDGAPPKGTGAFDRRAADARPAHDPRSRRVDAGFGSGIAPNQITDASGTAASVSRESLGDALRNAVGSSNARRGLFTNTGPSVAPTVAAGPTPTASAVGSLMGGTERSARLGNALTKAIDEGQLFLQYQPIFDLDDTTIVGLEALARWEHPEDGLIAPSEFLQIADETGQSLSLGAWVLESAADQVVAWRERYPEYVVPPLSINVTARELLDENFRRNALIGLTRRGLHPSTFRFEIKEQALLKMGATQVRARLQQLANDGFLIDIEDFGAGVASITNLQQVPASAVKIHRDCVQALTQDADALRLVQAMVAAARALDLTVVAVGVETADQKAALQRSGCQFAQGYLLARPLTPVEAARFFVRNPETTAAPRPRHEGLLRRGSGF